MVLTVLGVCKVAGVLLVAQLFLTNSENNLGKNLIVFKVPSYIIYIWVLLLERGKVYALRLSGAPSSKVLNK